MSLGPMIAHSEQRRNTEKMPKRNEEMQTFSLARHQSEASVAEPTHFKIFAISGYCESPLHTSEFIKISLIDG